MSSRSLPGLGLTGFWNRGADYKDGMDANLRLLSALGGGLVVESATAALPGSPADGVIYIVPASDGTNPGKIAIRDAGAWVYVQPIAGLEAFAKDTSRKLFWSGSAWLAVRYAPLTFQSAVAVAHTGNTTETALATVTIPGGSIGANGSVEISPMFTVTNNANIKRLRIRLGGTEIANWPITTLDLIRPLTLIIHNVNSQSSQKAPTASLTGIQAGSGATPATASVNTAVDANITITAELANAADALTLQSYLVRVNYGA